MNKYNHIKLEWYKESQKYKPKRWRWPSLNLPERSDRHAHWQKLLSQLNSIENEVSSWISNRQWRYIEFSSLGNFDLAFWSLETKASWIDLLNTKIKYDSDWNIIKQATVFIPYWKEDIIKNKILKYEQDNPEGWKPKNQNLVSWIENIKKALLESFWTDSRSFTSIWNNKELYEIWLNILDDENKENYKQNFINSLNTLWLEFKNSFLQFPTNLVMIIYADKNDLERLIMNSDYISEVKLAKEVSTSIWDLNNFEQSEWTDELLNRIEISNDIKSRVFVLDTWVNEWHPLLKKIVDKIDSIDPTWWYHDHEWHWTEMSWIVWYWDLIKSFQTSEKIKLSHKLWSVKILPPKIKWNNPKELWWDFTKRAISRAEIISPLNAWNVNSYCLAITAEDDINEWRPSSWSASVDQIIFNEWNIWKNILISTWNSNILNNKYPEYCQSSEIEDPGQSWNAITVWAYTDKCIINDVWTHNPLAKTWEMSPHNRTSLVFSKWWPIKPEIVFEWWNLLKWWFEHWDLDLITTSHNFNISWDYTYFRWTSASTALAWNFLWILSAKYPELLPQTIRWLMIHSSDWSRSLLNQFWISNLKSTNKESIKNMMKCIWYWIPNIEKALYSKENSLSIIIEEDIQPYKKEWSNCKLNEIHFFELPWPKSELLNLWNTEVKLKITLSYFIEPSPWEKWWKNKYKYQSYWLKFELNNITETKDEFISRINIDARNEDYEATTTSWSDRWLIWTARNNWSIHSDCWIWTASELANCNILAVYPLWWWWKDRPNEWKSNKKTNYSLIVSLETDEENIELYTTIKNMIDVRVAVPIEL